MLGKWCSIEYAIKSHVRLDEGSSKITVRGSTFYDALVHGGDGEGYGVALEKASQCLVENNIFHHLRHSVSLQQNPSYNVIAYNASFNPAWTFAGIPILPAPPDLSFHGHAIRSELVVVVSTSSTTGASLAEFI